MIAYKPASDDAAVPGYPLESVQLRGDEHAPEGWLVLDDASFARMVAVLGPRVVEAEQVASIADAVVDKVTDAIETVADIRALVVEEVTRALKEQG